MDYQLAIEHIITSEDLHKEVPTTKEKVYAAFNQILCKLSPREERILRIRSGFGFGTGVILTIEEIAMWFSISKKRVKKIEDSAISKLEEMVNKIDG